MSRPVPDAALLQHIAVLGKTGSGKTYAAKAAIVEPLLDAGARVGIVDPTGAWWGLRSSKDGKAAGFKVLILGGDHCDLPLPALGGAAVARLLVEQGVNLVADTSQFTVGERTRWFIDFANTVHRLNRSPLHVVLDEAHNFAPQGKVIDPDAGKMLHAANRLAAEGRSRGIRLTMITQRPQKLHKDTLTSADTLIAMRVLAPHDRMAVEDWIKGCGDPAQGKEVLNSLASLARGEGWVWYPEGAYLRRLTFPAIKTFDSSATPTGGALTVPKGAAEMDLTEIRAALADAVKEAEANDPKLLRARIATLEREAKKSVVAAPVQPDEKLLDEWWAKGHASGMATARDTYLERFQQAIDAFTTVRDKLASDLNPPGQAPRPAPAQVAKPAHKEAQRTLNRRATAIVNTVAEGLTGPQQRVLDAVAWWEAIGQDGPQKNQVGFVAGYRVGKNVGGTFGNILGQLRAMDLIGYPAPGCVTLTAQGKRTAHPPRERPTTAWLHGGLRALLDGPEYRVLSVLIEAYPGDLTKQDCGASAGYTVGDNVGGTFGNILGRLRSLGLIDYPAPGRVIALPVLFIEE